MCGVVGYVGRSQAAPVILEGLKCLEYRGYDSAGLAVLEQGSVEIRRSAGKISALEAVVGKNPLRGTLGVGHTRWATHGRPSEVNAHPHSDCSREIVVVHNGIIENYPALKERLLREGHAFGSETDTEVISHLIESHLRQFSRTQGALSTAVVEPLFFEAVRRALKELRGSYALGILWTKTPHLLLGARFLSPLVVGLGEGESFLTSDVAAFLSYSRKAVFLEDGDIAVLSGGDCRFFDLDGKKRERKTISIHWDRTMAEKSGYRHFMLKEIFEQPQTIEDTFRGRLFPLKESFLQTEIGMPPEALAGIKRVRLVACGSAFHAGMVGKYLLEHFAKVPCEVEIASEFRYRALNLEPGSLVVAVSQSGETADTLAAVRGAKSAGVPTLGICNSAQSSLTRMTDFTLLTRCGPEIGVASTKTFTGQLAALYVFTLHFALAKGAIGEAEALGLVNELLQAPGLARECLKLSDAVLETAKTFFKKDHFLYLGRHLNYPVALEGALKLKEISYIHAEGYAAGEMKHGPIALIDEEMPVVAIATASRVYEKMLSNLQEARSRGGKIIALLSEGDASSRETADFKLVLPRCPEFMSPLVNVMPLQLLAYHIAALRGCDVDQPRNLAKSVTVE
ncbi:MAG: glutamine--fructose-6-phosphate transaminase (isomerizing) [Elusimicrobia bacterium]|nr:glutamine--fructose-6-phosphate transaminase (isomerizing) [Elusimicrobiota bacterium]